MVKWNRETIKKAAKKFKFRKEWREKDKKSYAGAQKKGLLHDKEIAGHLITIKGALPSKWPKEKVLKSAKKFKYKRDWNLRESGAYQAALRNGYMAEATKHMKTLGHIYKRCLFSPEYFSYHCGNC